MSYILSLGAGVQSSTLALLPLHDKRVPMPRAAIFADVGSDPNNEPNQVYSWLEDLEKQLPYPVYRASVGNLGQDFLEALEGKRSRCSQPPFYVKSPPASPATIAKKLEEIGDPPTPPALGDPSPAYLFEMEQWQKARDRVLKPDKGGMLWRRCTRDYKIVAIKRKARSLMKEWGEKSLTQMIGISTDEAQRCKDSRVKYITNIWPLIDLGMSRTDCLEWMRKNGYGTPPRSACTFCPYRSNANWQKMKEEDPESFEQACQWDEKFRAAQKARRNSGKDLLDGPGITGEIYVWRGFAPLRTADFAKNKKEKEIDFLSECEGMCGL